MVVTGRKKIAKNTVLAANENITAKWDEKLGKRLY